MIFLKMIAWIMRRFQSPRTTLARTFHYLSLLYQAERHGGQISFGKRVQLNQKVIFQGRGKVILEDDVILGYDIGGSPTMPVLLQPRDREAIIEIGSRSALVNGTEVIARERIQIGKGCRIGARCVIIDADFHGLKPDERRSSGKVSPVVIGNNVWLGLGVTVLKGVTIGDDAVLGAGCVAPKDIPAGGIAVGNPARIVGSVYNLPPDRS